MIDLEKNNESTLRDVDGVVLEVHTGSFNDGGQFYVCDSSSANVQSKTSQEISQDEFFVIYITSNGYNQSTTYPEIEKYLEDTKVLYSCDLLPPSFMMINLLQSQTTPDQVVSFLTGTIEEPADFKITIISKS
ncbi:MAG: hypothetical protein WA055_01405 [Candidatus Moraniibacteriota bacterium]